MRELGAAEAQAAADAVTAGGDRNAAVSAARAAAEEPFRVCGGVQEDGGLPNVTSCMVGV